MRGKKKNRKEGKKREKNAGHAEEIHCQKLIMASLNTSCKA